MAISLEGLERLCKRKYNDQELKKRGSSTQLWISKSQLSPNETEQQSFFCLCDCERPSILSTCSPSSTSPLPALDTCRHRIHTAFSVTNAFGSPWMDLVNTSDNVNVFIRNINCNSKEEIVILYNDNILTKLLPESGFTCRDSGSVGIPGRCMNNNIEGVFKCIDIDKVNISKEDHHDQSQRNVIKEQTDSDMSDDGCTWKTRKIRRKSVSFSDDVVIFLYDKDSPAKKSHPESPSSLISEILFDDNGLEWEDDFLALEKNCQPRTYPKTCRSIFSLPTQNWTVNEPKSLVLSQSCLFLTHVNESDLEL